MANRQPVQVIAISGGKGGVGKTTIAVNISVALARLGRRVMLLDGDLGLANVDVLLGVSATQNLADVITGECSIEDILLDGPAGIKIIPASSGTQSMTELSEKQLAGLISAFSELNGQLDVLIIDTASGISDNVINVVRAAQEVLIVVTDDPTSITGAYALIKLLNTEYGVMRFRVIANMVRTAREGHALYNKLVNVTERFLDVALIYMGAVPFDEPIRKSIQRQKAVIEAYPRSKSALALGGLAEKVDALPLASSSRGHVEFFVESLVGGENA